MFVQEVIESIIIREVKGLCSTCIHTETCIYFKTATKEIIQCEVYDSGVIDRDEEPKLKGLCKTCDNAPTCQLRGRRYGVWHCNEFA